MYIRILQEKETIKKAKGILKAIDHTGRLCILRAIQAHGGRATVTQIYFGLRMEQSVASQHLAILRKANVVETEREGKNIYYSINEDQIRHYLNAFHLLLEVNLPGRLPGSIYMHNIHHPDELKHVDGPGGDGEQTADTAQVPAADTGGTKAPE